MVAIKVEHFIYGPVPKKGYSKRARSSGISPDEYERRVGYYIPIDPANIKSDDLMGSEARALISRGTTDDLYFSKIARRPKLDEKGRTGVLTHTVLLPKKALREGLTFAGVEAALNAFEKANGIPIGEMAPLELQYEEGPISEDLNKLRDLMSKDSLTRVAEGFAKDPNVHFVLTCRGTDQRERIELGYLLFTVLDLKMKLVPVSFLTEQPLSMGNSAFNMILSKIPLPVPREGWRAVSTHVDRNTIGSGTTAEEVREAIEQIYPDH